MFVLVTYDVVEKRTEKFRSLLCRYLVHEQNSVFSGTLTKSDMDVLRSQLKEISITGDRLMVVIAANRHNVAVERLEADERGILMPATDLESTACSVVL